MDRIRRLFRGPGEHLQDQDALPGSWPDPGSPPGDRSGSLGDGIADGLDDLVLGGRGDGDEPHSLDQDPGLEDELPGGGGLKPL
jgi:hypothetical protein